jgi:hypothetical protein
LYGFETDELLDGSRFLNHGWPTIYLVRSTRNVDFTDFSRFDTSRWAFKHFDAEHEIEVWRPRSIFINLIAVAVVLTSTCFMVCRRERSSFSPWSITLRELLVLMAMMCMFMALSRTDFRYWPLVTWKPLLFFPILFGLYAVAVAITSLLSALICAIPPARKKT